MKYKEERKHLKMEQLRKAWLKRFLLSKDLKEVRELPMRVAGKNPLRQINDIHKGPMVCA
jgi:hypothetical protein